MTSVRFSCPMLSCCLIPCFCKAMTLHGYVTADITYSTVHVDFEVLTLSWAILKYNCMSFTMKALSIAALGLQWNDIMVMLWKVCYGSIMAMLWPCYDNCYGCCVSQERLCYGFHTSQEKVNASAFPMAPRFFFHPLGSCLTLGSENSVHSKTIGIVSRMHEIIVKTVHKHKKQWGNCSKNRLDV